MMISEVLNDISDIIFPPQCMGCAEILHPLTDKYFVLPARKKLNL